MAISVLIFIVCLPLKFLWKWLNSRLEQIVQSFTLPFPMNIVNIDFSTFSLGITYLCVWFSSLDWSGSSLQFQSMVLFSCFSIFIAINLFFACVLLINVFQIHLIKRIFWQIHFNSLLWHKSKSISFDLSSQCSSIYNSGGWWPLFLMGGEQPSLHMFTYRYSFFLTRFFIAFFYLFPHVSLVFKIHQIRSIFSDTANVENRSNFEMVVTRGMRPSIIE